MDKKAFYELCQNQFHFLFEEYGFQYKSRSSSSYGYEMLFQNETTALYIYLIHQEQLVGIKLCELIGREFDEQAEGHCYNVFSLKRLRLPNWQPAHVAKSSWEMDTLTDEKIEHYITEDAQFIKEYAQDILNGDFRVFDELYKIMGVQEKRDHSNIEFDKGKEAFESGNYELALSCFRKSFDIYPSAKISLYIAKNLIALGKDREAYRAMQTAHMYNRANPKVTMAYAEMLADRGDVTEAIMLLDTIIEIKTYRPAIRLRAELKKHIGAS